MLQMLFWKYKGRKAVNIWLLYDMLPKKSNKMNKGLNSTVLSSKQNLLSDEPQLYLFKRWRHCVHDVLLLKPLPSIASLVVVADTELQLRWELHEGHVVLQTAHL